MLQRRTRVAVQIQHDEPGLRRGLCWFRVELGHGNAGEPVAMNAARGEADSALIFRVERLHQVLDVMQLRADGLLGFCDLGDLLGVTADLIEQLKPSQQRGTRYARYGDQRVD